ncbi:hypothetical protein VTI28DRAFT_7917 [Corynascus sepedonium]
MRAGLDQKNWSRTGNLRNLRLTNSRKLEVKPKGRRHSVHSSSGGGNKRPPMVGPPSWRLTQPSPAAITASSSINIGQLTTVPWSAFDTQTSHTRRAALYGTSLAILPKKNHRFDRIKALRGSISCCVSPTANTCSLFFDLRAEPTVA